MIERNITYLLKKDYNIVTEDLINKNLFKIKIYDIILDTLKI